MKKTKTATEEIVILEKLIGGDPQKALRNRRVKRAIQTIRHAWSEEPMRFKVDLDELMLNTIRWNWPLRIYTPEQRQAKEEQLRAKLERNRPAIVYVDPELIETPIEKLRRLGMYFLKKMVKAQ